MPFFLKTELTFVEILKVWSCFLGNVPHIYLETHSSTHFFSCAVTGFIVGSIKTCMIKVKMKKKFLIAFSFTQTNMAAFN